MLRWALGFLVLALTSAFFGFGGVAAASLGIAKTTYFLFLAILAGTLILGLMAEGRESLRAARATSRGTGPHGD